MEHVQQIKEIEDNYTNEKKDCVNGLKGKRQMIFII